MGSDPGTDIPPDQGLHGETLDQHSIENNKPTGERCSICGLVARNNVELDEHIKHAHRQGDPNKANDVYSNEQKIDPFVKKED
jgi:hypothetical protein